MGVFVRRSSRAKDRGGKNEGKVSGNRLVLINILQFVDYFDHVVNILSLAHCQTWGEFFKYIFLFLWLCSFFQRWRQGGGIATVPRQALEIRGGGGGRGGGGPRYELGVS